MLTIAFFQINGEIEGINPLVFGLCTIMGLANACINPVLYGYLNESFREEYKNLFSKLPWYLSSASQAANGPPANNNIIANNNGKTCQQSLSAYIYNTYIQL